MTDTMEQLWWDENFILKRIAEQKQYLDELLDRFYTGGVTVSRYSELAASAMDVYRIMEERLRAIKSLEGYECSKFLIDLERYAELEKQFGINGVPI